MTTLAVLLALGGLAQTGPAPSREEASDLRRSVVQLIVRSDLHSLLETLGEEFGQSVEIRLPAHQHLTLETRLGSGIVLDRDGHVATTAFLVGRASDIRVRLQDGQQVEATLVGLDHITELAVVRIDARRLARGLDPAAFHPAGAPLAYGTPVRLVGALALDRCSATEAHLVGAHLHPGAGWHHDFLLLRGTPPPGAAGGPVIDPSGSVMGMILASRSGTECLAVPAATVQRITRELVQHGRIARAWLGITSVSGVEPPGGEPGIPVLEVAPASPAERAGIRPGDRIVSAQDRPLGHMAELIQVVNERPAGSELVLGMSRQGEPWTARPTLVARPEPAPPPRQGPLLGVEPLPVPPELKSRASLPPHLGILVGRILPRSPAALAGLRAGDVLTHVGGAPVSSQAELDRLIHRHAAGERLSLELRRDGEVRRVWVTLSRREPSRATQPNVHLALDAVEWQRLFRSLQGLSAPADAVEEIRRILEGDKGRIPPPLRRWLEALQQELRRRAGTGQPAAAPAR